MNHKGHKEHKEKLFYFKQISGLFFVFFVPFVVQGFFFNNINIVARFSFASVPGTIRLNVTMNEFSFGSIPFSHPSRLQT